MDRLSTNPASGARAISVLVLANVLAGAGVLALVLP
jgi:hypothetical protein